MSTARSNVDESVEIVPSEDGKSFTVVDTGLPAPTYVYEPTPMTKNDIIGVSIVGVLFAGVVGAVGWFSYKEDKKLKAESAARMAEMKRKREEQDKKLKAESAARMAEMKRKREERQEWFDHQRREGRTVIETIDGEYLAIPNEAYTKAEIRKKAL
jgi:hypothetical protein